MIEGNGREEKREGNKTTESKIQAMRTLAVLKSKERTPYRKPTETKPTDKGKGGKEKSKDEGERVTGEEIATPRDWENTRGKRIEKIEKMIDLSWKNKVGKEEIKVTEVLGEILRIEKINKANHRQTDFKLRWGEKVKREERIKLGKEKGEECWLVQEMKRLEKQEQEKKESFEICFNLIIKRQGEKREGEKVERRKI